MSKKYTYKITGTPSNAATPIMITREGTCNMDLLYENYIKLAFDEIVIQYCDQVNKSNKKYR